MTPTSDAVRCLSHALDQFGDLLEHVHQDDLRRPTPCAEWDVALLVGHVTTMVRRFTEIAHGARPDLTVPPEPVTHGWTADFRNAADDLLHAWHRAGNDASPESIDWQVAELAVHAWDLARALDRPTAVLDEEVAARGMAFMGGRLTTDRRFSAFGEATPVSGDAPVQDRLAAFAGRDPGS